MQKTFLPQSRVLGATQEPLTNSWNMPEPLYYVEHKNNIRVPVYRGISAKMANHYRGQARRAVRKRRERENAIQGT